MLPALHSFWPCRARGMLVISDEIFAGLWRLGSASAWERLHIMPDIACYAKLLTGVPLPICPAWLPKAQTRLAQRFLAAGGVIVLIQTSNNSFCI